MDGRINNHGTKGNKGGRRKGYEYEEAQQEQMRKIISSYFSLLEKVRKNRAKPRELIAFTRIEKAALKIMDKLHANKQEIKGDMKLGLSEGLLNLVNDAERRLKSRQEVDGVQNSEPGGSTVVRQDNSEEKSLGEGGGDNPGA